MSRNLFGWIWRWGSSASCRHAYDACDFHCMGAWLPPTSGMKAYRKRRPSEKKVWPRRHVLHAWSGGAKLNSPLATSC